MATEYAMVRWRIRLHLLVTAGGINPKDALQVACDECNVDFTTPMQKYPHSYTHGAKKWLQQQIDARCGWVIKLILEMDDEIQAQIRERFPQLPLQNV